MRDLTISIYGNQIFSEIMGELKIFSKYVVKSNNNLNLPDKANIQKNYLVILFLTPQSKNTYKKFITNDYPIIILGKDLNNSIISEGKFVEQISVPFNILELEKKITSLFSKFKFNNNSLISLLDYTIDKNERKIKKNNIELQLTEKEVNFLIIFTQKHTPLNRNFILKKVWGYSNEIETHTVETHIHRLRKKILEKFNDNNFIKNNANGYYI